MKCHSALAIIIGLLLLAGTEVALGLEDVDGEIPVNDNGRKVIDEPSLNILDKSPEGPPFDDERSRLGEGAEGFGRGESNHSHGGQGKGHPRTRLEGASLPSKLSQNQRNKDDDRSKRVNEDSKHDLLEYIQVKPKPGCSDTECRVECFAQRGIGGSCNEEKTGCSCDK